VRQDNGKCQCPSWMPAPWHWTPMGLSWYGGQRSLIELAHCCFLSQVLQPENSQRGHCVCAQRVMRADQTLDDWMGPAHKSAACYKSAGESPHTPYIVGSELCLFTGQSPTCVCILLPQVGFNLNLWSGLQLLHYVFAKEHNSVCDMFKTHHHPTW
jgi:hypothetical protein